MFKIVSLTRLFELERDIPAVFHPRWKEKVPRLVARLISGSRSGWVGIEALRPENIRRVEKEEGGKERKVNKNLGEITVPGGGKLRLISCTRLSPSCLHLRSRSLTRSNLFPSLSLSPLYYIPPAATRKRSPYYYWEQSRRRIVRGREGSRPTYFTFLPKRGPTISSSYSPFTPPRRRASNGWCMQRYTRARPLVYLLSRVALTREFANRTRKIAVSLTCFFPTRALPFRSKSR